MLLFRWLRFWMHWVQRVCFGDASEGNRARGSVLCLAIGLCYVVFNSFFLDKTPLQDLLAHSRVDRSKSLLNPIHKPVGEWNCADIGNWLKQQPGWGWEELNQYAERLCRIGLTGNTLHVVDESVLAKDIQVMYTFHQKLLLEALRDLQVNQRQLEPRGSRQAKYKPTSPAKAAVYFAGLLCTPRMTVLWLWSMEYIKIRDGLQTLQFGDAQVDSSDKAFGNVPGAALGTVLDTWTSVMDPHLLCHYWLAWLLCPGLTVTTIALRHFTSHPCIALYAAVIGVLHTAAELCVVHILVFKGDMLLGEKCIRLMCSHLVAPLVCVLLGALQMVGLHVLPSWLSSATYWLLCLLLPPWTCWGCFGTWADQGAPEWSGHAEDRSNGYNTDVLRRHSSHLLARELSSQIHWPPPIAVPPGMIEDQHAPSYIKCPITLSVMRQPAQTAAGITYEYGALMQWLDNHRCDPVTRAPLKRRHVVPNLAIRAAIEQWLAQQ